MLKYRSQRGKLIMTVILQVNLNFLNFNFINKVYFVYKITNSLSAINTRLFKNNGAKVGLIHLYTLSCKNMKTE